MMYRLSALFIVAAYIDSLSIVSVLTQLRTFEQYRMIVLAGEAQ